MIPLGPQLQIGTRSSRLALAVVLGFAASAGMAQQAAPGNAPPQEPQTNATPKPDAPKPDASPVPPDAATAPSAAQPAPGAVQDSASPQTESRQAAPSAGKNPQTEDQQTAKTETPGGITEEELKRTLAGKPLYLRDSYQSDSLTYNEHGVLIGHAPQTSYTLSVIQIDKVHLTRHKVELQGARYGLHFLGALAYDDPTKAVDRVKITPKKKVVKITIDRELVVRPKKVKSAKEAQIAKNSNQKPGAPEPQTGTAPAAQTAPAPSSNAEPSDADQAKAEIDAAPPAERLADPNSVTTTTSPAHATKLLKEALDNVFAQSIDDRMIAAMPDFWRFYYQAATAKTDYRPTDPAVLRQNTVDQKAKLVSNFEPASNQYAQDNGVAGMSLYHVVIGADGKPEEIAVARPIGFGLDENAVEAIRNAKFEPAMKDGKPVPVLLDLVVRFRIYSKRTAASEAPASASEASEPSLPGPYSAQHP